MDNYSLKKKPHYPVSEKLREYLNYYSREIKFGVEYKDLTRYNNAVPLYNLKGKDTLWESVLFPQSEMEHLNKTLIDIYSILKTGGDTSVTEHLSVDRIDYCTFGNSNPFRIRILNIFNENFDYFYVKQADASRIYGLQLEHILSPNRITYFVDGNTLIEEHIAGIPGDMFIENNLHDKGINELRLAKEFVKFNERCFVRLLGDMRSYNYIIDITPDFEQVHYRIRAIDFDQQSYEGRKNLYFPQYFKENKAFVDLCIKYMTPESVLQYKLEEYTLIVKRIKAAGNMFNDLLKCMCMDTISTKEKIANLAEELANHYQDKSFLNCTTMGELVNASLQAVVNKVKN
ncbi:MAG: hypothetical protein IPP71_00100 [Bacteroidetes bacterium]|nr:hypothetical protein [Bacteroidota bacterium]